jgi:hypothetical protein
MPLTALSHHGGASPQPHHQPNCDHLDPRSSSLSTATVRYYQLLQHTLNLWFRVKGLGLGVQGYSTLGDVRNLGGHAGFAKRQCCFTFSLLFLPRPILLGILRLTTFASKSPDVFFRYVQSNRAWGQATPPELTTVALKLNVLGKRLGVTPRQS